ncbi:MAG TPA: ribonuclease J [Polyangiaceae bacterium]|nr:ribonuclease J [Polyangiaceae bacterium]
MAVSTLRIVPLGGLGEIGMNCLALETEEGLLVIDCGLTFPEDDHGIELLHPDFSYLLERADKVRGVFLTHGHEDHIGGLPYLLPELNVPVWGPPHALKLALRRIRDRAGRASTLKVDFRPALPGQRYEVGPFVVEPIRVAHSIIEATALYVESAAGSVLHTGDFKFDRDPPDGQPTDEERLLELGDRGVDVLLSDSTNIDSRGTAGSESDVAGALAELIGAARQRVVVGLFSSNVQRLISLGQIAKKTGRRIGLLGRSLRAHVEAAHDLGHLAWPVEQRLDSDEIAACHPSSLLVLAGGTQAEAGSAMTRIARASHPALTLAAGDSVILSSRVIPGNDRRVSRMVSELLRLDVELHTYHQRRELHTSGHASQEELRHMIELVRPRCFIPVHGARHHLHNHAELARRSGVEQCLVIENGEVASYGSGRLQRADEVHAGRIAIDRGLETLSTDVLRERVALGRSGIAQLCVVLDSDGALRGPARLSTFGVVAFDAPEANEQLAREAEQLLQKQSKIWTRRGRNTAEELEKFLAWRLERLIGMRPYVTVQINQI